MAIPTDSNDTFLREVDENLRRDQFQDFFKKNGVWIALGVVLFLAAAGGFIYWQEYRQRQAAEQSEQMHAVFTDIAKGTRQTVPQRLGKLEQSHSDIVRASAMLTDAALALDTNNRPAAIAKYRELIGDKGIAQIYRDIGTIRLTALEFDTLKPAEVVARLEPLAKPGNPWFGSAGEMTALAYLKQNRKAEAGKLFAQIAADNQVPNSIRTRAVQVAGTLGVDASASLPGLPQQD
ncbi:MAG: tetratricopeptide repeat protein [Sphingomonas sp.]|nr:tetratricopeptide repeat protein [Sphingomonas sp.]